MRQLVFNNRSLAFVFCVFANLQIPLIAEAQQVITVCHGEYYSRCLQHPFNEFEHCGDDNGVGGADPDHVSGPRLCGQRYIRAESAAPSTDGNHCGYAWYRIICTN